MALPAVGSCPNPGPEAAEAAGLSGRPTRETQRHCIGDMTGKGQRLIYVADRFDDCKLFRLVLALGEGSVARVYHDRRLGNGRRPPLLRATT